MTKNIILFILAFSLTNGYCVYCQNDVLYGIAKIAKTETTLSDVQVSIDKMKPVSSDEKGMFNVSGYDLSKRPVSVLVKKEGYELAGWVYENNSLEVSLRPATIKNIYGKITSSIPGLVGKKIFYNGSKTYTAIVDSGLNFKFSIPYDETVNRDAKFSIKGHIIKIVDIKKDEIDKSISLKMSVLEEYIYTVFVKDEDQKPITNAIILANNSSFVTDKNGKFRIANPNSKLELIFKNYHLISADVDSDNQLITAIFGKNELISSNPSKKSPISQKFDISDSIGETKSYEDSLSFKNVEEHISQDLEAMEEFYHQREAEFIEQNERIQNLNDSLSHITEFNDSDHEHLLRQLQSLNSSLTSSTKAFETTRQNSIELIAKLRQILNEKEETIKEISQEKEELAKDIRNNIQLFISIFAILSLFLLAAAHAMRRIKVQNRVIEKTKRQLLNAQEIARVGSMNYNMSNSIFTYSDNFFPTVGIKNHKRKKNYYQKSDGMINVDLIDQKDQDRVRVAWKDAMNTQTPLNLEFKGNSDSGEQIFLDLKAKFESGDTGKAQEIMCTLQDVTQKKESENRLLQAMKKVEEATKIKEEFLASMSHEIRTPLNAIIGLTDHLISNDPREDQLKNLSTIQFSSKHLTSLVNDILDYSKIRAGKVALEKRDFSLVGFLEGLKETMQVSADEKRITLGMTMDNGIPNYIKGDELRINQVLTNLINNAIKFTSTGGVDINASLKETHENYLVIEFSVEDTGLGIEEEKLDKIFEGFEQENTSTSRQYGGTGLGLSISKELVLLFDGELRVESEIGKGSKFYFDAKFENSDHVETVEKTDINTNSYDLSHFSGVKVLCVEDNMINQLVISQYFEKWEVDVVFAETGEGALNSYREQSFDLVFMDIRLPDMSGYEVTERMLAEFQGRNTPIIGLTAEIEEKTVQRVKESGMVDFLGKPFEAKSLNNIMTKYLRLDLIN